MVATRSAVANQKAAVFPVAVSSNPSLLTQNDVSDNAHVHIGQGVVFAAQELLWATQRVGDKNDKQSARIAEQDEEIERLKVSLARVKYLACLMTLGRQSEARMKAVSALHTSADHNLCVYDL
jgi:hypothetical protein